MASLPPASWDTHVHVFDPVNHPYIPDTRYTPPARSKEDLVAAVPTTNFVIVMSGPEGTDASLTLETIAGLRGMGRQARGVVVMDLEQMTPAELQRLDRGGVRSVRFNTRRDGTTSLASLFYETAQRVHAAGLRWSIEAAIFDVAVWHGLVPTLRRAHAQYGTVFVADHVFAAQPAALHSAELASLLELVDEGALVVKVSGLTRYGRNPQAIMPIVSAILAQRGGQGAIFGSDWPNVDSTPGSTKLMEVDIARHLQILQETCAAVGPGVWQRLMQDNAAELYK